MSPRWTKMVRDSCAARGRLWMIVVALAASIAALTTMLSAYGVLMREVPRNYLSTNPASAQLQMEGAFSDEFLRQVRSRPNIAAAQAGATLLARMAVGRDEWLPLLLFVVPDFESMQINTLRPEAGVWPPPPGTMLVERSALAMTRTALGGRARIQLPRGGSRSIAIVGTVHDPGLAPAWQEQTVYGYVTPQTLASLGEPVTLDLLKIVVSDGASDAAVIGSTVRELASWITTEGHRVLEARIPPPQRHPHQAQMSAVLAMLLMFSLLALVLGAVLTATVVGGLLAQHVRQIAIMKAVGARERQIVGLYLGLVGGLGAIAVAIGLPLGLAAGRAFIARIAELLNLRIESLALPWWVYGLTLGLGIAVPVICALIPIRSAARRTVRNAIDDHGVSAGALTSSWMTRGLARVRVTDAALNLAARNVFRRRARSLLTLSLLAGAGAMFVTSLNLEAAWERNVAQAIGARHFDLEIGLQKAESLERVMRIARAVPGVADVEAWSASTATIPNKDALRVVRRYPDGGHGGIALRGAPPATRFIAHSMVEGRWLQAEDRDAVVINTLARTLAFSGVRVGDSVTLSVDHRPLPLRVVGVTHELLTPGAVYVTPETFARATQTAGLTNVLRVALADRTRADTAARDVVQALERDRVGVRFVLTEKRFATAQSEHVYILVYALGFIAALMAVVGMLGLASSLGTSVMERTREFGVMRAVGAPSAAVIRCVLGEGVMIGVLSWVVALALSLLLSAQVGSVLAHISAQELSLRLSTSGAASWLCIVLIGSTIVSFFPARRASRLTVRQTLVAT